MKNHRLKTLFFLVLLIAGTAGTLAYSKMDRPGADTLQPDPETVSGSNSGITVSGKLSQNKVFLGGDGHISLVLTLEADEADMDRGEQHAVDMVIVLDRSGSMDGYKINQAKKAIVNVINNLSEQDRFGLVSYSDGVTKHSGLIPVTDANKRVLFRKVNAIGSGGGTNLGAGLQEGIKSLSRRERLGNQGKLILISDGLANQGITDINSLGDMAAKAVKREFSVSTVGVGDDFNELLMTHIADSGIGYYHYLTDPVAFAEVFNQEIHSTRNVAANAVTVHIPLIPGVHLKDASGYPIDISNNKAVIRPGNLLDGQKRTIYLTFSVPTREEGEIMLSGISTSYVQGETTKWIDMPSSFRIECVRDKKAVFASIDKDVWEEKVLHEDYNRLQEQVARDIKEGKKDEAKAKIKKYEAKQREINAYVASPEVAANLEQEVDRMEQTVEDSFTGTAAEVQQKQKVNAKSMQYRGYSGRRK